ncbi:CD2 antigen cytoplasmic tail-binding protein 2 isoform X2 [Telopea speciosissima]|uniref:CD2 antigen cytoplasmic tail-binding protein 2 isoform X2 n=1 Tax=Telopea speciosissima TaxID=54955 RepID=UPI001CC62E28|nr:CD2 antigen cytoplasmic tail-binding protein 2 isoform X2 [Telopea speciosissima]
MEETASRAHLKRPLSDDDEPNKQPMQKKVRFPKGKKVKVGDEVANVSKDEEVPGEGKTARLAAKERAKRRNQITAELFSEEGSAGFTDVLAAEVHYEENANFDDDGIQIEPFNLKHEREEGYFDADGNFVEYVNDKETKDAWLDSVEVDTKFAYKCSEITNNEEDTHDLSAEDIGKIKRRIADLLESGETVLQALRRLKGTSSDRKGRMSEDIKLMFDQLTEDAMNLLENGDYNVYHEKKEVFEREAEGYERLARARDGTSVSARNGNSDSITGQDMFSNGLDSERATSQLPEMASGSTAQLSSSDAADSFDMFAEDEENGSCNLSADANGLGSGCAPEPFSQPASGSLNQDPESGGPQTDYIYDESSGYYYSSSLGYYYDPTSELYCCATSGSWYSFNEQTGTYDEIQNETTSI